MKVNLKELKNSKTYSFVPLLLKKRKFCLGRRENSRVLTRINSLHPVLKHVDHRVGDVGHAGHSRGQTVEEAAIAVQRSNVPDTGHQLAEGLAQPSAYCLDHASRELACVKYFTQFL